MTRPPGQSGFAEDPDFVNRLARALEQLERGQELDTEAICSDRPELEARLRAALHTAAELPALHEAVETFDPLVGQTIADRYEIRTPIGSGTKSVVYEAHDRRLKSAVALKVLRTEILADSELELRFHREADALAAIRHPSVVTFLDRGKSAEGQAYFAMARLHGRTSSALLADPEASPTSLRYLRTGWLRKRLDGGAPRMEWEPNYVRQAVGWTARIARALQAAHAAGAVHCEVQPAKIFITSEGCPILLGFGHAMLDQDPRRVEAPRSAPAYLAPEQVAPKPPLSSATDVYGLAATLYHFLTFAQPYAGTPAQILAALRHFDPRPAHELRPGLPREMQAILDRGLARDPAHRYPSAEDLAIDLEAWLDYRPVLARPVSPLRRWWRRAARRASIRTPQR